MASPRASEPGEGLIRKDEGRMGERKEILKKKKRKSPKWM
jgi:hypothetical protein